MWQVQEPFRGRWASGQEPSGLGPRRERQEDPGCLAAFEVRVSWDLSPSWFSFYSVGLVCIGQSLAPTGRGVRAMNEELEAYKYAGRSHPVFPLFPVCGSGESGLIH